MSKSNQDEYTRSWIIENALEIISEYRRGELTIRALHYQLVGRGMTNTMQHYKRVVAAMEVARWDGRVDFEAFSDLDREMVGSTNSHTTDVNEAIENAKEQIKAWMKQYRKNRWENQPWYAEVFIEKKALQNVFQRTCYLNDIALGAVKGYPSLTFLYETAQRFKERAEEGKKLIILYFGDYDPSGEDIPRSIEENLHRMGAYVEVRRFSLFESQVVEWNLPPAPTKEGDTRTAKWDGLGQVELDAVKPEKLREMCQEAIDSVFDYKLHRELMRVQDEEIEIYQTELKEFVKTL